MPCDLSVFAIGAKTAPRRRQRQRRATSLADKLRKLLFALETAENLDQLGLFPGWKLHPLKGDLKGFWSLTVTGNWRLIFRYDEEANTAADVDLIDYH